MSHAIHENLYSAIPVNCNSRNIYDKENIFIGVYNGFRSRPTTKSDGHIQITTPEGDFWIGGRGVYIEGMGIKLVTDILFE